MPKQIHPLDIVKKVDSELQILCKTSSPAKWKHSKNNIGMPNVQADSTRLLITKVKVSNRGVYTCKGTTNKGYHFYSVSTLKVLGELAEGLNVLYNLLLECPQKEI